MCACEIGYTAPAMWSGADIQRTVLAVWSNTFAQEIWVSCTCCVIWYWMTQKIVWKVYGSDVRDDIVYYLCVCVLLCVELRFWLWNKLIRNERHLERV